MPSNLKYNDRERVRGQPTHAIESHRIQEFRDLTDLKANARNNRILTVSKGAPSMAMSKLSPLSLKQLEYGKFAKVVRPLKSLPVMMSIISCSPPCNIDCKGPKADAAANTWLLAND